MEAKEETRRFVVGIEVSFDKEEKPKLIVGNINMPNDIAINQLRLLTKMLEEDYYPNFKKNVTKIGIGPE